MAKGHNITRTLCDSGKVSGQKHNLWDFIYRVSTAKDPNWNLGDKVELPDGRIFRYAKSAGNSAFYAAHGVAFSATGYTSYTAFGTSYAVGVSEIECAAATHAALTADELRGGYIIIFDGASDYYTTTRGILGNTAASANAAFTVQLDAAITYAITAATSACEVYQNPWAALELASLNTYPKAGIPAAYVSAAANYFWVQTNGITWVAPQSGVGGSQGQHGCFWRHDGALDKADTALATTVPAGSSSQYAGFVVEGSQAGNGPLFMLQGA
jgi:hypothetical protein